jgi:hypothetical protein
MNKIEGKVVKGKQKATSKGFPTANLMLNDLPENHMVGLWAGIVKIRQRYSEWYGIANILENSKIVEIHIKEFNAVVYDEIVEFELVEKMEQTKSMKSDIEQFKTCADCMYCIHQDYGYSNWTVEGTTSECSLNRRPDSDCSCDISRGELFAVNCSFFRKGEPQYFNVDDERP